MYNAVIYFFFKQKREKFRKIAPIVTVLTERTILSELSVSFRFGSYLRSE